jgi:Tol biopolymer transport system component
MSRRRRPSSHARRVLAIAVASAAFVAAEPSALAQEPIERVSVNTVGQPGDASCDEVGSNPMSSDGRFVAFSSHANDLVPGGTNGQYHIFVRDRAAGTTVLMSVASDGTQGNSGSQQPAISGDGRYVAFMSYATNLVAGDTNGKPDVFLHDRDPDGNGIFDEGNGTTIRISMKKGGNESSGESYNPAFAEDGSIVAFESKGDLTKDHTSFYNIYAYVLATGTIERVSVGPSNALPGGDCGNASVSKDGSSVAFDCKGPFLVNNDNNGHQDVFVRDRVAGTTTLASVKSDGTQGDADSFGPSISGDGSVVVFVSEADNLVANDTNHWRDVFAHDLVGSTTTRVDVLPDGSQTLGGDSWRPWTDQTGTLVVFYTYAFNLIPVDNNTKSDVVLVDRSTGVVEPVSTNCIGWAGNDKSMNPSMTHDGRFVSFLSQATDLVDDGLGGEMVYLRDRSIPWPVATATNYGSGWPGTHGVPSMTSSAPPVFGTTIDLTASNSLGRWTLGFLLVGGAQASIPALDGTILVDWVAIEGVAIPPSGYVETDDVPNDTALCGAEFDFQMLEFDAGASKGVSFTPGLQLIVGR